jgi:hypothetical protein
MGLLDDAIREHLDLKRRRGADPTEVERAEREALGPVRRGPEESDEVEPGDEPAAAYDHEDGQDWGEEFDDANGLASAQPGEPEPYAPPQPAPEQPDSRPRPDHLEPDESLASDEPFASDEPPTDARDSVTPPPHPAPASSPPDQPREHVGEETVEYEVESALEQEGEGQGDDVLEETPEFLQDTPDHDRLWFEQRPPRDFDFEG